MAVKVRVSYDKPQELQRVKELLHPVIVSCKAEKGGNKPYKRAYIECDTAKEGIKKPSV